MKLLISVEMHNALFILETSFGISESDLFACLFQILASRFWGSAGWHLQTCVNKVNVLLTALKLETVDRQQQRGGRSQAPLKCCVISVILTLIHSHNAGGCITWCVCVCDGRCF